MYGARRHRSDCGRDRHAETQQRHLRDHDALHSAIAVAPSERRLPYLSRVAGIDDVAAASAHEDFVHALRSRLTALPLARWWRRERDPWGGMVGDQRASECPGLASGETSCFFLKQASPSAFRALEAAGTRVVLSKGQVVFGPDHPLDHVYFLDEGIAAIVAKTGEDRTVGCALIGSEGYLLPAAVLGANRVANRCQMIVGGTGLQVPLEDLSRVQEGEVRLHDLLLKFAYALITQLIATTLSQSNDPISARLCRLILMLHDRSSSDDIRIRHSDCAVFLGVRRSSVTEAMHLLEGDGMVSNDRGFVSVSNRSALVRRCASSYGKPEHEYNRTIAKFF